MGKSGTITVNVYNTRDNVTVLSARSAAVRFFNVDSCEVKRKPPINAAVTESTSRMDGSKLSLELQREFPAVFDLSQHQITLPMKT